MRMVCFWFENSVATAKHVRCAGLFWLLTWAAQRKGVEWEICERNDCAEEGWTDVGGVCYVLK